jgi:hypothetical protein
MRRLYGPHYGLSAAISGIDSFWFRGYGNPPPQTLIVVGLPVGFLENPFSSCQLVAHTWNRYGVENEETRDHPDICVKTGRTFGAVFAITISPMFRGPDSLLRV